MSMKKFTKKMLAIVAAGAMTMGLAIPVFAEGAGTTTKEAYITKVFNTEVAKDVDFTFSAVQQKNENGEIEIGIPDMIEYFSTIANMSGFDEATEKCFFIMEVLI